jgi:hypothetical protein
MADFLVRHGIATPRGLAMTRVTVSEAALLVSTLPALTAATILSRA